MIKHVSNIATIATVILLTFTALPLFAKDFTVVIDPGHGGKDCGARGVSLYEKDINLAVAKKLGDKIEKNHRDVKVIFTRKRDTDVALKERPEIANKANGDLFISIHVNSVDRKARNRKTINGAEVYTLGLHRSDDNLAVAMRENAVMALESDYTEAYQGFDPESSESYIIFELSQSRHMDMSIEFADLVQQQLIEHAGRADKGVKQAGFWVLWSTSMPSVLIELDFICNPTQEKYLGSEKGQDELAEAISRAFDTYLANHSQQTELQKSVIPTEPVEPLTPAVSRIETADGKVSTYHIQIMTSNALLDLQSPEFKGLKHLNYYQENDIYKYIYGSFPTFNKASKGLKSIKSKFPQAFIIEMRDGKRTN